MTDKLTPLQRHNNMAAIHGKDTKPEMVVRRYLWGHGYRYRLNHPRLPGKPDIVMRKYRTCIFVNGCFWHGHEGCQYYTIPKTNTAFWMAKIKRNQERDVEVQRRLASMGWHSITIWECELKPKVEEKLVELSGGSSPHDIKKMKRPERDRMLKQICELDANPRQVSRITGISYGVIFKAKK